MYAPPGAWETAITLSPADQPFPATAVTEFTLDVRAGGDAVVAWSQNEDLMLAERTGGTWTMPADASSGIGFYRRPDANISVAMADSGVATIFFGVVSDGALFQSVRAENGTWAHPAVETDEFTLAAEGGRDPLVAMQPDGAGVAAYWMFNAGVLVSTGQGDAWSHVTNTPADVISDGGDWPSNAGADPQVAIGGGHAVVVWRQQDAGSVGVYMSESFNGGAFSTGALISPLGVYQGTGHIQPNGIYLDVNNNGDAVVMWGQNSASGGGFCASDCPSVFVSEYTGGTWTHPADIDDVFSSNEAEANQVQTGQNGFVGIADDGSAVLVYNHETTLGQSALVIATRTPDGTWTVPPVTEAVTLLPGTNSTGYDFFAADLNAAGDFMLAVSAPREETSPIGQSDLYIVHRIGGTWHIPTSEDDMHVAANGLNNMVLKLTDTGDAILLHNSLDPAVSEQRLWAEQWTRD